MNRLGSSPEPRTTWLGARRIGAPKKSSERATYRTSAPSDSRTRRGHRSGLMWRSWRGRPDILLTGPWSCRQGTVRRKSGSARHHPRAVHHVDALRRRAPIDPWPARAACVLLLAVAAAPAGCGGSSTETARTVPPPSPAPPQSARARPRGAANVYAADGAGHLSARARRALQRVYVPNTLSDT